MLEKKVEQFIERHHLFGNNEIAVVGVSGGPDSIALLHFLKQRETLYNLNLVCCSVDHRLRGRDSVEDVAFVKSLSEQWRIPFEGRSVDVPALMLEKGIGAEEAARELRFQAFEEVLSKYQAKNLILAQHGDDQIETMLMRHVRGGTGNSLAGMPVVRQMSWGFIIRPFLCVTKDELLNYCEKNHLPFRVDETNETDDYTRNRFRHHVLPFLKSENPKVHLRFQQQSEWMFDDDQLLTELAEERLSKLTCSKSKDCYILYKTAFRNAPVSLQRRILHLILNYLYKSNGWKPQHQTIHIDLLLTWLKESSQSGEWSLPGNMVARTYNDFLVIKQVTPSSEIMASEVKKLPIPGHFSSGIGEFKIELSENWIQTPNDQTEFVADFETLSMPLSIRFYQSGDRIRLMGRGGTKKVSRVFIDHKVPKEWRTRWPLVLDGAGDILWIPLLKRSSKALCTGQTSSFFKMVFRPSKDFGRIM